MKIISEQKTGIIGYIEKESVKQYDDSITVQFQDDAERLNNKIINHNGVTYYFGSSNRNKDGSYTATFWKNKPVW